MTGMVCRGALLVVGVLGGWCFISVVQRFRGVNEKISEFGVTSMAPYLLHIYFLLIAQKYGMANWLETISPLAAWCIVLTCSLAMTIVFAQIGRRWTWLFDFSWLGQVTEYVAKQLNKKFI